jgi:hypothetical protein
MGDRRVEAGQQLDVRDGIAPAAPRRFNAAGYDSFVAWANAPTAAPGAGTPLDTFADPSFEAYSDVFNRYGAWESDPALGSVWYPTVGADWRPYTDGYWQSYGAESQWLWVGRDPFGWPTHHFGRWDVNNRGRWYWMPGRQWAPAWVSWSVGPGYIGWTPLGSQDRPVRSWDTMSQRHGVYPGGTLDPSRAWTVVPADHFGRRDRMSAYAVDPRTLDNLSAFVSQRVGPPARYNTEGRGYLYGGRSRPYGGSGGTAVYGPGGYYGGMRQRPGGDATGTAGGAIGPTRVAPASPGDGGPTPPSEDPYERAQRAVAPRSRQRPPQAGADAHATTPDRSRAPAVDPPPPAASAPRQRSPSREAAPPPPASSHETGRPPAADPAPPPAADSAPPASSSGRSTGRHAVPRP